MLRGLKSLVGVLRLCGLGVGLVLAGCGGQAPAPPSFTPGSGGSDFGTLNDGKGANFQIQSSGDRPTKVTKSDGSGTSSFEFDDQGRIVNLTANDQSKIDLTYKEDDSAEGSATGVKVLGQDLGDFTFDLPPGSAPPTAKAIIVQAQDDDEICARISVTCSNVVPFVNNTLRPIAVQRVLDFVAANEIPIPEALVVNAVNNVIDSYLDQVIDFCESWDFLLTIENPCAL
jgi:hypothetical protein